MKQKKMDKETRIRKAQERTDELFPGKDLNDMYEMYLEFFAEYERLWDEGKNVSERLKKQDKEGENTAKIVYNAQKRCKIIVEKYVYISIYNR